MSAICYPSVKRVRTHAIILTCNRPVTLERCLQVAGATSGPDDVVTVLDDSGTTAFEANAGLVRQYRRRWRGAIRHVSVEWLHAAIERRCHVRKLWQVGSDPRDIAPVRNLALLLARSVPSDETVLIDDDIRGFDLGLTRRLLDDCSGDRGIILGARMSGLSESDTVSRLEDVMLKLMGSSDQKDQDIWALFRAPDEPDWSSLGGFECPSGGYLGFRLPATNVCAFPPGYNEDWSWGLLQRTEGVKVLRSSQVVIHDPPSIRRSSRSDIVFELLGDLVVTSLAGVCSTVAGVDAVLSALKESELVQCELPAARAVELWSQYACLAADPAHENVRCLGVYGALAVGDLVQSRELEAYGKCTLREWADNAAEKQADFRASIVDACSVASDIEFEKSHIRT